jgi:hypothetical protein
LVRIVTKVSDFCSITLTFHGEGRIQHAIDCLLARTGAATSAPDSLASGATVPAKPRAALITR